MTEELLYKSIICGIAIVLAILEGNGIVYVFNKIPAGWLSDYSEEPSEELKDIYTQRVKSYPWKYIFTMLFIVINIKMFISDLTFGLPATAAIWLLIELAIGDRKYGIVPDQFLILLAVTGIGFVPYQDSVLWCIYGALAGFGITGASALLGKMTFKRDTIGGGDIKLFTVLGFLFGPVGIIAVMALSVLLGAGHMVILLAMKKIKRTDTLPMVPYITIVSSIYLVFFWDNIGNLLWSV